MYGVAQATAEHVASALAADDPVLVLGGDCTVELGTVAGALRVTQDLGLVYIDLDTDLNTPESTQDGALDWMGVAHMLGIDGTMPELAALAPRTPCSRVLASNAVPLPDHQLGEVLIRRWRRGVLVRASHDDRIAM